MLGPDKQGQGTVYGAALGAGTGAITGAQLSAGTGPGAVVGAGLGGVFGMFQGLGMDLLEEEDLKQSEEVAGLEQRAAAQRMLALHYEKRTKLTPSRDIFPADWFFYADQGQLMPESKPLARELAKMTKTRTPWSRIAITSYISASDRESPFAKYLAQKRAEELALEFVRSGIDPRRVVIRGMILDGPLVIDEKDQPSRYRQAIEITPMDN